MQRHRRASVLPRAGAAFLFAWFFGAAAARGEVSYSRDIKPILAQQCYECHGPDEGTRQAGLRLDTRAGLLGDGNRRPAVTPGNRQTSQLYRRITAEEPAIRMPPGRKPALDAGQIELIGRWIQAGAAVEEHWAFLPPQRPEPPEVEDTSWPRNEIDRFILAELEAAGIAPSPEADKRTLVRRVYLDLIGLPPPVEAVERFLADESSDAYERVVEELLASPHYGERWARHWLDAARYADSHGYSIDGPRSIWKYRDWVIDAFNQDKPFDRFVIEQLAGDLLPEATLEQRIATGFHRNTMINQEGGIDREEFRVEAVVDRVATTGSVFLGLTMACAQCHTHKYDPITHREYFQFFAFFNSDHEDTLSFPAGEVSETTLVLRQAAKPRETRIHLQGDFTRPGDAVTPGVPAILHPLEAKENPTRLDLARWLMEPANPLTARVTVNRFWQRFFGRGIVETENDFGIQGILPTHPELLDWLATEFQEQGWGIKAMHRLIATSAVYRQASHAREDLREIDPRNLLLARQARVRLDAEIIRDTGLGASGLLHPDIGGPSVFPPQPAGVMGLGQVNRTWDTSEGGDRYRRGMYTFFWRGNAYPALTVFDAPRALSACTRRNRSNTPLQALTLLNDQSFVEMAQELAYRVLREVPHDDARRMDHLFALCLSRGPSATERAMMDQLLGQQRASFAQAPDEARLATAADFGHGIAREELAAWTMLARAIMNTDEFITRE